MNIVANKTTDMVQLVINPQSYAYGLTDTLHRTTGDSSITQLKLLLQVIFHFPKGNLYREKTRTFRQGHGVKKREPFSQLCSYILIQKGGSTTFNSMFPWSRRSLKLKAQTNERHLRVINDTFWRMDKTKVLPLELFCSKMSLCRIWHRNRSFRSQSKKHLYAALFMHIFRMRKSEKKEREYGMENNRGNGKLNYIKWKTLCSIKLEGGPSLQKKWARPHLNPDRSCPISFKIWGKLKSHKSKISRHQVNILVVGKECTRNVEGTIYFSLFTYGFLWSPIQT